MSGGRPAACKHLPIVEDATTAGEPDSAGRQRLRRGFAWRGTSGVAEIAENKFYVARSASHG
jgi:hypothetical protein